MSPHTIKTGSMRSLPSNRRGNSDPINASQEPVHATRDREFPSWRSCRSARGAGPSPISTGLSSRSTAGMPWLPRTRLGSSGTTSKKRAESQLLPRELQDRSALRPESARVEEQLARVIAGLAVDVDRAGEIGGQAIVEPVRISKP